MLNRTLTSMPVYATKAISKKANTVPDVCNLSIGEPVFGPPDHLIKPAVVQDLTRDALLDALNRYEISAGSLELRQAIAAWYQRRYGMNVDAETEVLVTHGAVEAIALAVLCATEPNDVVGLTDPSYMLYERSVATLGRRPKGFRRAAGMTEYAALVDSDAQFAKDFGCSKAIIVNSPENPTGYVLSRGEWEILGEIARKNDAWIIHDEVYDTMDFDREHIPARSIDSLASRTIMINSCSKKFGTPGLRIGWMVANEELITIAAKAHDYLYLGVNILFERIAVRMLTDPDIEPWLSQNRLMLRGRRDLAVRSLSCADGFTWDRHPMGAMFLFPDVQSLYEQLPDAFKAEGFKVGTAVANYLLDQCKVAVVPGEVYGSSVSSHIRLVLCSAERTFQSSIDRLGSLKFTC
jgi:aminotransferase